MGLFQKLFEIEKRDNRKDIHEKSQNRRENHLGVVVNRNFLGRGAEVGFGNAQLSHAGKGPRQDQVE